MNANTLSLPVLNCSLSVRSFIEITKLAFTIPEVKVFLS